MTRDEFEEKYGMLPDGCRVLCAVSGGADSIYLLHHLVSISAARQVTVFAAHFNHLLRGEESDRDAGFTQQHCAELGVHLVTGEGDVRGFAEERHCGLEEAARIMRYRFLEKTADELKCDRIATAHNADDNAETILMNLCRGAGTLGLAGIPPRRGRFIRPLLHTSRSEIETWLTAHSIPWVTDSSNADQAYTRNRFRRFMKDFLLEENPSFLQAAFRTAELLRTDNDFLDRCAERFLAENFDGTSIPGAALAAAEPAVATRVVRLLCGGNLSMERTCAVLRFAAGIEPGVLELPGRKIQRRHGRVFFPVPRDGL